MHEPILVTGGTGTLGRLVVERLRSGGHDVRVLSRGRRDRAAALADPKGGIQFVTADLATGEGIDGALEGVRTVIDCAGSAKGDADKARNLVEAGARAGLQHLVYISVVGADRIPMTGRTDRTMFGYFGAKLAAERIVAGSGLPWTTLRATQFQELTLATVAQMARLPVIPVPSGFRFQPIDASDVADRLVELALAPSAGLVPDLGGPRAYEMADLVRSYLRATGKHRLIAPVYVPGKAAAAIRAGANLTPDRAVGRRTWEDFLAERVTSPKARSVLT
jgi:uncharacterized protein YbjT (DUF2867 family)